MYWPNLYSFTDTRQPRRVGRYPKINWGRGRLLPYESIYSFVAKFTRLNGIGARECRYFLRYITNHEHWKDYGFDEIAAKRLSRLLDEPMATVKTIGFTVLRPSLVSDFGQLNYVPDNSHQAIYFCPNCLSMGYHATFHSYAWLKKCPVHCSELVKVTFPMQRDASVFDRAVEAVGQLLDRATSKAWLSPTSNPVLGNDLACPRFKLFCRWIHSAQRYQRDLDCCTVLLLGNQVQSLPLQPMLLDRITWAVPMPNSMVELVRIKLGNIRPSIINYPVEVVRRFASLFNQGASGFSYRIFAEFYKSTIAAIGGMPKYRELVLNRIDNMRTAFANTEWQWGYSKYGWELVSPKGWPYWMLKNPLDSAIDDLHLDWAYADFFDKNARQRSNARLSYMRLAGEYVNRGLLLLINDSKANWGEIYRPLDSMKPFSICIENNVIALIEEMLYHEAKADLDAVQEWLIHVAQGGEPVPGPVRMSPGNLLLEEHRAELQIWPTVPLA